VLRTFLGVLNLQLYAQHLSQLLSVHLDSTLELFAFLSRTWCDEGVSSSLLCTRALELALARLDHADEAKSGVALAQVLLPSLLVALDSPTRQVRLLACRCLEKLQARVTAKNNTTTPAQVAAFYGIEASTKDIVLPSATFLSALSNIIEYANSNSAGAPQIRRLVATGIVSNDAAKESSIQQYLLEHACMSAMFTVGLE
jgi:hypothetical protein